MPSNSFLILAVLVDDTTWVSVAPLINCNSWSIRPDADILICTDPNNPQTQDTIKAGVQDYVIPGGSSSVPFRFPAGQIIFWIKAVSGSTTAHLQFSA